ncbi:hypothetical protein [uncultured Gelidibacter sp.]|uniref:hypothetical protein n=1 Tax=uncultured Gelidibacter sp. TaxID=259318 RepID=UPI002602FA2F|nr:hypothetical protein [uncultured Gelidibacter sp.]
MIQKLLISLVLLLCFSCGSDELVTPSPIVLKVNGCFEKSENDVRICLDSVLNDSRCPKGLLCVWEGDATAAFTLRKNQVSKSFNLHTNTKFQNDTVIDGVSVKLVNITPYPTANDSISASEYKAEIRVEVN